MAALRVFAPVGGRLGRRFPTSLIPVSLGLCPRDFTGIHCAQVFERARYRLSIDRVIHRADARLLDSCDEHRNEGRFVQAPPSQGSGPA
jgi:hypothetical protein